MTRRPERIWHDPPMPDNSSLSFRKISGYFTRKGIVGSLLFVWSIWAVAMIQYSISGISIPAFMLIGTFILLTVYAILISPILEWSFDMAMGKKL